MHQKCINFEVLMNAQQHLSLKTLPDLIEHPKTESHFLDERKCEWRGKEKFVQLVVTSELHGKLGDVYASAAMNTLRNYEDICIHCAADTNVFVVSQCVYGSKHLM